MRTDDDPDATVLRGAAADPDATVLRRPAPVDGDDAGPEERDPTTLVKPRRLGDATTLVALRTDDSDATVIRNTLVQKREAGAQAGAPDEATVLDTDRTRQRGEGLRPLPKQRALALPKGLRLHEYRVERVLGQGGFGITYLATDANLDAEVAVKEYLPEEIAFRASDRSVSPNASQHRERYQQGLENFLAEARTLASFRHPNIVRVARFFEAHQTAYMVLEYERGKSFKKWWLKQKPEELPAGQGERLLVERLQPLLDGLSTVHAAGFLHRDIKPDNIQVRAEDGRLVLLDFGSAGQTVALADQDAVVVTPGYAPVEQYGIGEQGAWTDIYALAATLYWAVAGKKPPDAEARASGTVMTPAVEVGKGRYGRSFLEAIDWALQMDPAARPANVEQWRDKLLADHVASIGIKEALRRGDALAGYEGGDDDGRSPRSARLLRALQRLLDPSGWPLAAKLALLLVATALLPMLVTGLYNLNGAQEALQESQLKKTELLAHSTAGRIAQLLGDNARLARGLGGDGELQRWLAAPGETGAAESIQQRLSALVQANPDLHFVMVMDAGGTTRISTDRELIGRNFAFREYFREAMAGRPFATGIVVGAAAGAAGVFFAEPVRAAASAAGVNAPVQGAVVLRVRADAVAKVLDEVRRDPELTPFLLDADGVVVQHADPVWMYKSLVPLSAATQARIKADQRFRRDQVESLGEAELDAAMKARGNSGPISYRGAMGSARSGVGGGSSSVAAPSSPGGKRANVEQIAGFAPVPGHGFTVVVSESRESFERPLSRLLTHLQISLVLIGLLFVGLALRFARSIVRRVDKLTAGAQALKAGRFEEAYVNVKGRDEIGALARTFNVMVDVLRQRERERETRR